MTGSPVAVVVDADLAELRKTEHALEGAGFVVIAVDSFAAAKALLVSVSPEIIIADIKLHAFNGLHLAAICSGWRPGTPFVTTHAVYDPVLESDAHRLGTAYVVKTETREELKETAVKLVLGMRGGTNGIRRWPRKQAPTQTRAAISASDAEVLDISYGGIRVRIDPPPAARNGEPPETFDILFPELELALRAARIWASHDARGDRWLCGADITANERAELDKWREFVDSVS